MHHAIVIEKAEGNYSAYIPDLLRCIATGAHTADIKGKIREAVKFYIAGMREDEIRFRPPSRKVEHIEIAALPNRYASTKPSGSSAFERTGIMPRTTSSGRNLTVAVCPRYLPKLN